MNKIVFTLEMLKEDKDIQVMDRETIKQCILDNIELLIDEIEYEVN